MTDTTQTRPINYIRFCDIDLLLMLHDGMYIEAQKLVDYAGLDWRSQKRILQEDENVVLFGTKWIPDIADRAKRRQKHPAKVPSGGTRTPGTELLCLRFDRVKMFLARISTRNMKAKGKVEAAERLLAMQVEWAEVLHSHDDAENGKTSRDVKNLLDLTRLRDGAKSVGEKELYDRMLTDTRARMGYSLEEEPQGDMFTGGQG